MRSNKCHGYEESKSKRLLQLHQPQRLQHRTEVQRIGRPTPSPRCGLTSCGHQTGSQLTRRAHMRPMENGAEGGSRPLVFPQAQPPTPPQPPFLILS